MNDTRYGHTSVGGGDQDQAERKDEGWRSRQGGDQSREPGSRGEETARDAKDDEHDEPGTPPAGTNTQGGLAGIGEASDRVAEDLEGGARPEQGDERGPRARDTRGAGTDQPPRMGGPLGPDRRSRTCRRAPRTPTPAGPGPAASTSA